jgi:hypothetical protein
MDDHEQRPLRHPEKDHARLAVVLPVVQPLDREHVAERRRRELEADTVLATVGDGLRRVPLELRHEYWFSVSPSTPRAGRRGRLQGWTAVPSPRPDMAWLRRRRIAARHSGTCTAKGR